jgi:hypothetical protein
MLPEYEFYPELIAPRTSPSSGLAGFIEHAGGRVDLGPGLIPMTVTINGTTVIFTEAARVAAPWDPSVFVWHVCFTADGIPERFLPDDRMAEIYVFADPEPDLTSPFADDASRLPDEWCHWIYQTARKWILASLLADTESQIQMQCQAHRRG